MRMATQTIDMRMMRYINLFRKISHVSTTNCFVYNNMIIFAVPKNQVYSAIGRHGENVKRLGETLRKKVKVISAPVEEGERQESVEKFVESVVSPVSFNKIEIKDGVVSISAGRQSKAALIGRNRTREKELEDSLKKFFRIQKLRIV